MMHGEGRTSPLSSAADPECSGSRELPAGSGRPRHIWGRWAHRGHHDPSRGAVRRGLVPAEVGALGRLRGRPEAQAAKTIKCSGLHYRHTHQLVLSCLAIPGGAGVNRYREPPSAPSQGEMAPIRRARAVLTYRGSEWPKLIGHGLRVAGGPAGILISSTTTRYGSTRVSPIRGVFWRRAGRALVGPYSRCLPPHEAIFIATRPKRPYLARARSYSRSVLALMARSLFRTYRRCRAATAGRAATAPMVLRAPLRTVPKCHRMRTALAHNLRTGPTRDAHSSEFDIPISGRENSPTLSTRRTRRRRLQDS